jgi:hypothetical protein
MDALSVILVLLAPDFWDTFDSFNPDNWFRQVPEGMEFLGAVLTILGSLGIMVLLGKWWEH